MRSSQAAQWRLHGDLKTVRRHLHDCSMLARCWLDVGSTASRCRLDVGSMSARCRLDCGKGTLAARRWLLIVNLRRSNDKFPLLHSKSTYRTLPRHLIYAQHFAASTILHRWLQDGSTEAQPAPPPPTRPPTRPDASHTDKWEAGESKNLQFILP